MSSSTSKPFGASLQSTAQLLSHFISNLSSTSQTPSTAPTTDPVYPPTASDPLKIIQDSSKLIRAHATKLGLLLLNKPFTPSAITKILSDLTGTCLPALISVLPIIRTTYGSCIHREYLSLTRQVLVALQDLLRDTISVASTEIPDLHINPSTNPPSRTTSITTTATALTSASAPGTQASSTLASVAQTWSACDALTTTSPPTLLLAKADSYRALIRDAIDELKEWIEDEDEGYDGGDVSDRDGDVRFGPPAGSGKLGGSGGDEEGKSRRGMVEGVIGRIGLLEVGVKAIRARRLKGYVFHRPMTVADGKGKGEGERERLKRLDGVMDGLGKIPGEVDELAGALYEDAGDGQGVRDALKVCCDAALAAVSLAAEKGWGGAKEEEDEAFGKWVERWRALLVKPLDLDAAAAAADSAAAAATA